MSIIADILNIAKSESLKTQIMYKANLSFAQLKEYLSFLLEVKLIMSITQSDRKAYRVTPRGMRFLQNHAKIEELLKIDRELKGRKTPGLL